MIVRNMKERTLDFLLATQRCEMRGLEQVQQAVHLVSAVRGLVHELQRERGASNLYLGSEGKRHAEVMLLSRERSDRALADWLAQLDDWHKPEACAYGRSRLLGRIAMAAHVLNELDTLRHVVHARQLAAMKATQAYSEIIGALLAVAFEAADTDADVHISRLLLALINLMQGKELSGQERAIGAAGFSCGGFNDVLRQALQHRIYAQAHSFEVFHEFADDSARSAWDDLLHAPEMVELIRLRRLVSLDAEQQENTSNAARWFESASWRIDAMKHIEDSLEQRLLQRCEQCLSAARAELVTDEGRLRQLADKGERATGSYAVFYDAPGRRQENALQDGQSVLELVHEQAKRLQVLEDELRTARQALRERKLIERAKSLLMQQQQLGEEQAYRLMRQTAMNQNRRLAEVAEMILMLAQQTPGGRTRM